MVINLLTGELECLKENTKNQLYRNIKLEKWLPVKIACQNCLHTWGYDRYTIHNSDGIFCSVTCNGFFVARMVASREQRLAAQEDAEEAKWALETQRILNGPD